MRLVLAAVSSNKQLTGVTRHAANLARCLLLHTRIEAIHVIAAPWEQQILRDAIAVEDPRLQIHCVHLDSFSLARNLWYFFDLPEIAAQLDADVVHLSYPAPLSRRKMPCPVVVTVHDLYAQDIPENFGFPKVFFNRLVLQQSLRAADALACVSNATLERLRSWEPSLTARATRIYNSVEPTRVRIGRSPVPKCRSVPFLLCVAQHRRNKNVVLALRTLARLLRERTIHPEMMLLVVGMAGPETETIERCIEAEGLGQNVMLLAGISETELQWCYRNCEALLAPSLMEGFGLPVAEGMLAGCRIVCSDIPPFRELGRFHCRCFSLGAGAEERFAEAIRETLSQPRTGPAALPYLSGKVIAGEYLSLYTRLVEMRIASVKGVVANEEERLSVGVR